MSETPSPEDETGFPKPSDDEFRLKQCSPPSRNANNIEKNKRRNQLQNERYDEWKDRDELEIWGDDPGLGKTTNIGKAGDQNKDFLIFYFPKHENAHEFRCDDAKPDVDLHLKGPEQPADHECMDAKVNDEPCEKHGDRENCPRMCSVFDLPDDNETRKQFEKIADERGTKTAHEIVDPHDDDGDDGCEWEQQWQDLDDLGDRDDAVTVVTVFSYMASINHHGHNILDDIQNLLENTDNLSRSDLKKVRSTLRDLSDSTAITEVISEIEFFVSQIIDALDEDRRELDDPTTLSDIDPPEIEINSDSWIGRRVTDGINPVAEALAWVKHAYHQGLLGKIAKKDDRLQLETKFTNWEDTPLGLDIVFAAAAEAGLSQNAVRQAIAANPGVEKCPSCGAFEQFSSRSGRAKADRTIFNKKDAGKHVCDACEWHEHDDRLTDTVGELPREVAWIGEKNREATLRYEQLPLTTDLPDSSDTLILDATPTKRKYALLFGLDMDEVVVTGSDSVTLNAEITQIHTGQYHQNTIENASEKRKDDFNDIIRKAREIHDGELVVSHSKNKSLLDVEDDRWMYFHAGRGLNREDPEAIVILGAPHPNEDDLKRKAKLLAMDRDDVQVGGKERSSRRNKDGELAADPPISRKYYYEDKTEIGRKMTTKDYTGLVGKLFRDNREHEIVQLAHRLRPTISEEKKHIYLITNVPTELPVDTLASISELVDPVYEQVGISEGAVKLLEMIVELYEDGRPHTKNKLFYKWNSDAITVSDSDLHGLVETHKKGPNVDERQVRNYREELQNIGLVSKSDYVQNKGRLYQFEFPASKDALLILNNNTSFEVDAVRRLGEKVNRSECATEWIEWAKDEFDLSTDNAILSNI